MVRDAAETPPLPLKSNQPFSRCGGNTGTACSWQTEQCEGWEWELNGGISCAGTQREHAGAGGPGTGALSEALPTCEVMCGVSP